MTAMPHLAAVDWDHADRMQHADLGGGGDVWFVYDSAGNRVRKVRVNLAGSQTEERIDLGGVELYRERQGGVLQRERQTVHIGDDTGRICLVETLTVDAGAPVAGAANQARYQYGNHLGSASLELDEAANTISYEEYHPYGSSAYRAVDSAVEVSAKRYRYTGQERDEETGLDSMGARYYASWLGRWTAADPIGLGDGVNRYAYVGGKPIVLRDPSGTRGESVLPALIEQQTALIHDIAATGRAGGDIQPLLDELDTVNAEFTAQAGIESNESFVARHGARNRAAAARRDDSLVTAADVHEFSAGVSAGVDRAANVAGEVAQDVTPSMFPGADVTVATTVHTTTAFVGSVLTGGVALAGKVAGLPEKIKSAAHNLELGSNGNDERLVAGVGETAEVVGTFAEIGLLFAGIQSLEAPPVVGGSTPTAPGGPSVTRTSGASPRTAAGGGRTKRHLRPHGHQEAERSG
ncbi:MAG: RHS repeat-associated core domain-containing protein [Deltaproteobacteria bacterium]|nr:RHS repeat-associated core domain-containing protein [Deltaproteobacteria bacterium]